MHRRSTDKIGKWTRLAAGIGVLLSRLNVQAKVSELFQDGMNTVADTIGDKSAAAVHRVNAAAEALRGRSDRTQWRVPAVSFVVGLGLGAGLGILLSPMSGNEARGAIRTRAANLKDTIVESAATIARRGPESVA